MKMGHCKHEENNPITFQLNNIYYRNINVKQLHNTDDDGQAMGRVEAHRDEQVYHAQR